MTRNRFLNSLILKRKGRNQQKGFIYVLAVAAAALLILVAKTVYDLGNSPVKEALVDTKADLYFAEHPGPFCTFEGVWHDWEHDETITLGCLEVKGNAREGSYSSAMGPRATSNFSMNGTYDVDSDSCIRVSGKDWEGKPVHFTTPISVEDVEYPTQIIFVYETGQKGLFIWKRRE